VNGFITGEGGVKMSKSLGNVVNPKEIVEEYGTDALRYFMLREISSFEDSPFTKERFHGSYNSGLANGLGNLTSRIMKMAETNLNNPVNVDSDYPKIDISKEMDQFDISKAMSLIWGELNYMDGIIQSVQPFKLVKTDKEKGIEEIQMLVKRLDRVASTLQPFLPETSKKIKEAIKLNKMPETPLFLRKE
jgi:methionyl-tRNA synthetase